MEKTKTCDVICVHEEKVNNTVTFLDDDKTQKLMQTLLKISDKNKLKILLSLIKEEALCVCDLSIILDMSVASTSHHLRKLYKNDIINFYKEGKMAFYYFEDEEIKSMLMQYLPILKSESSS